MTKENHVSKTMSVVFVMLVIAGGLVQAADAQALPLPGSSIPKYVDPLPRLGGPDNRVDAKRPGTRLTLSVKPSFQPVLSTGTPVVGPGGVSQSVDPRDDVNKPGWTKVWAFEINNNRGSGGPSGNGIYGPLWPAYTIEAQQGVPLAVQYRNLLAGETYAAMGFPVDQTLHWANPPNYPMFDPRRMNPYPGAVPVVTHLHGAEVGSASDGQSDAWTLPEGVAAAPNGVSHGSAYTPDDFIYPNTQEATTLFYHDHSLGVTRLNENAGLVGVYFIRGDKDDGADKPEHLPSGPYEVEMVIQDRMFDNTGRLMFPSDAVNPLMHPLWQPEFFGDAMCVNGKTWPYLNVEARRYRFRIENSANARFVKLYVTNAKGERADLPVWQIGSDGGLLDEPVNVRSLPEHALLLGPTERADLIVDFSRVPGAVLTLRNSANAPYPSGDAPDTATVGQIMQFRVGPALPRGTDRSYDPSSRRSSLRTSPIVRLTDPEQGTLARRVKPIGYRQLTLNEVEGGGGPLAVLVNNSRWMGMMSPNAVVPDQDTHLMSPASEMPQVGSTEVWEIVNTTEDAHPIHIHLVQFQLVNRQEYDDVGYVAAYEAAFPGTGTQTFPEGDPAGVAYPAGVYIPEYGPPYPYNTVIKRGENTYVIGGNPDVTPYLKGKPVPPNANERGWKDTFVMYPGQVTRVVIRWAPQATPVGAVTGGKNLYAFDPSVGPGYVWHCHILDHEDNEMMRPQLVRFNPPTAFAAALLADRARSVISGAAGQAAENMPTAYALAQNYPNPFNPSTQIKYALPEDAHVTLTVYNSIGQQVRTLLDEDMPAGYHIATLDAKVLASGIYYYRLRAGAFTSTQRMILMK